MHRGFYFLKNLLREIGMQLKLYPLDTLISIATWVECGTTTGTKKKKNQILSISNLKNEDNNEVLKKKENCSSNVHLRLYGPILKYQTL